MHKRGLTIVSDSVAKIYDGTPLTSKIYTLSEGSLLDGHTEQIEVFGSQTEAGESPNEYEVIGIFDASGEDVTKNYEITRVQGMLNVAPRPITLETLPGHWIYDGEVHSNRQFKITSQIGIPGNNRRRNERQLHFRGHGNFQRRGRNEKLRIHILQ